MPCESNGCASLRRGSAREASPERTVPWIYRTTTRRSRKKCGGGAASELNYHQGCGMPCRAGRLRASPARLPLLPSGAARGADAGRFLPGVSPLVMARPRPAARLIVTGSILLPCRRFCCHSPAAAATFAAAWRHEARSCATALGSSRKRKKTASIVGLLRRLPCSGAAYARSRPTPRRQSCLVSARYARGP